MKLQAIVLVALTLCVAAKPKYRERDIIPELSTKPQKDGNCTETVQIFDRDFMYTYKYVAYTQHRDAVTGSGNDVRITCTATITVNEHCSGKLRISDCQVEGGVLQLDNRVDYHILDTSSQFDREMGVHDMAFKFNGGQITQILVDKRQRTDITNFKRGILASLQAYTPELPNDFQVGDVYKVPRMNVYGQGMVEHKILAKVGSFPTEVEIVRDAAKIELPWERRQWNFLRMRNNKQNPILSALKNYLTMNDEDMWTKSKQTCKYTLKRGRQVYKAECTENYPHNPVQPVILRYLFEKTPIKTTIRQEVTLRTSRRLTAADRSLWDVTSLDEDNIMFEEEWEETNKVYTSGFNAEEAFLSLVREEANDKTTALVSKLSRWMSIASQEGIENIWKKCEKECNPDEKTAGRMLWLELLNSCVISDWCQIPFCSTKNSTTCENALESFVRKNVDKSPEVKEACMVSLESISAPSDNIIDAAMRICRTEESQGMVSPRCVRTLGVVTKNFVDTCKGACDGEKSLVKAKAFLRKQLNRDCQMKDEENDNVMAEAVEWIGRLGPNGTYAEATVLACATNRNASALVVMKSLIAYGNITAETLPKTTVKKLVAHFTASDGVVETRITCFHLLMKKNLQADDVENILKTVMDEKERVREHCREDLRSQLVLRGTMFCQFNKDVAEKCVEIILKNKWDIGISRQSLVSKPVEKKWEVKREMYLPIFKQISNCTIQIKSVYETDKSVMPIVSKLTVLTDIEDYTVPVIEVAMDIFSMKPVLDRVFGHNKFYSQMVSKLLSTPMSELHGYVKKYPALNALKDEGRYSHMRNIFDVRYPIFLKVLGYEISFDSLMGIDAVRRFALGNFHEIVAAIEAGFEHETFVVGQPFLMQRAFPTSIGAPMISTVEMSYYMKNKLNIKANLIKMMSAPNEKGILNIAPEMHVTGIMTNTILCQFTKSCGTEMKFGFGHGSALDCSFDRTPQGFDTVCIPKRERIQLLYVNGKRSLVGPEASSERPTECYDYGMSNMYLLRYCCRPLTTTEFGYELYLENESDTEYRSSFSMMTKPEEDTRDLINEIKLEHTAEKHHDRSTRRVLWSSVVRLIPSRQEMQCDITTELFKWRVSANLMFPRHETLTGMNFNVKSSGIESLNYKYFSSLKVTPENADKYVVSGECKWVTNTSNFAGYRVSGVMEEARKGENIERRADFKLLNWENEQLLISNFLTKKVPHGYENMPGYETYYTLEGSILPIYRMVKANLLTYDNDVKYRKMMSLSGYVDHENNPHFFLHRVDGTWKQPGRENYDAEIRCVSNMFTFEYIAKTDAKRDTTIHTKIDFPERAIAYSEVVTGSNPQLYKLKDFGRPAASFIEGGYNATTDESGDRDHRMALGYRLWSNQMREYYHERALARYTKHKECRLCHSFQLDHPKVHVTSISRRNKLDTHEQNWIKLHYSLLEYVYLRPYVADYLINRVRNEFVELGYNGRLFSKHSGGNKLELQATFLTNVASCVVDYGKNKMDWESSCMIGIPAIPLDVNLELKTEYEGEHTPKIVVDCRTKYAAVGSDVRGEMIFTENNDFWTSFNATYGTQGRHENDDSLHLDFTNVDSTYDITGSYQNRHKPTEKVERYQFVGRSENIEKGPRNLEIKALCSDDPTKVCGKIGVNKEGNLIQYERLVKEGEHDRATIRQIGDKYSLNVKTANEMLFDVHDVNADLKIGKHAYGFQFVSKICNMSVHLADDFEVVNTVSVGWLRYSMMAMINSKTAKYEIDWDTREVRGSKLRSVASFQYDILTANKMIDARIILGSSPAAYTYGIKTPHFDFEISRTSEDESEEPTVYQYLCDAQVLPSKIIMKEVKFPIFNRDVEIKGTTLGCKYHNDNFQGIYMRDLSVSLSHPCERTRPMLVTGDSTLDYDEVSIKMEDADRNFVCDVTMNSATPGSHHFEFIATILGSKVDLLWDMKNATDKILIKEKCEISIISWKTKKMYPILTVSMDSVLGKTPDGGNFPKITMNSLFNHDLPLPFVEKKNKFDFTTTINGDTTTLRCVSTTGDRKLLEMTTVLTGCHRAMVPMQGYKVCMPNGIEMNMILDLPIIFRINQVFRIKKDGSVWNVEMNDLIRSPILAKNPVTSNFSAIMETSSCSNDQTWCVPKMIYLRNIDWSLPIVPTIQIVDIFTPSFIDDWISHGIHVTRSEIRVTRGIVDDQNSHEITSTLEDSKTGKVLDVTFSSTFATNLLKSYLAMVCSDWKLEHVIDMGYEQGTRGWHFNHKLDSPRIQSNAAVKATSPLGITTCHMSTTMPNGLIREFTLDYSNRHVNSRLNLVSGSVTGIGTHECSWDEATEEWKSESTIVCPWMNMDMKVNGTRFWIESCDLKLTTDGSLQELDVHFGEGNGVCKCRMGGHELLMKKTNEKISGNFTSESYPWSNQILTMYYVNEHDRRSWNTGYDTKYFSCKTQFTTVGYAVRGKLLECDAKENSAGVKVEYSVDRDRHYCEITLKDIDATKISCKTTAMADENTPSVLRCVRIKGSETVDFASLPVRMVDFPFIGDYVVLDKALFFVRFVEHWIKVSSYTGDRLGDLYQKELGCGDSKLCYDFAKRVKAIQYRYLKEMTRIAGPRMFYYTKPEITEYALRKMVSYVPGSLAILPQWSSINQKSSSALKLLTGGDIKLLHWSIPGVMDIKIKAAVTSTDEVLMKFICDSTMFPWLNSEHALSVVRNGERNMAAIASHFNAWEYAAVFSVDGGELYPIADEFCVVECKQGAVFRYNWTMTEDNRHNFTMIILRNKEVRVVCDMLSSSADLSNAEIRCYEGLDRESLIGKISIPNLSEDITSSKYTDFDSLMSDVFHIESTHHRNKVYSSLNRLVSNAVHKVQDYVEMDKRTKLIFNIAQYGAASFMHKSSMYTGLQEFFEIARTLMHLNSSNYNTIVQDMKEFFADRYEESGWWAVARDIARPLFDTVGHVMQCELTAGYEFKDGALVIQNSVHSSAYPVFNFDNALRVERHSYRDVVMKYTTVSKFVTLEMEAHFSGPRFFVDKIRIGIPGFKKEFIELRVVPNAEKGKPYYLELYFDDTEGYNYGCRGGLSSYESSIIHMYCYSIDGSVLPPNPSSSKLVAYWDIRVEDIYLATRTDTFAVMNTLISIFRVINTCSEDWRTVNKILTDVYHIKDAVVRWRIMNTTTQICKLWIEKFSAGISSETDDRSRRYSESEPGIVSYLRTYKAHSYEMLKSSILEGVPMPCPFSVTTPSVSSIGGMVPFVYEFGAPLFHYAYSVAEYLKSAGGIEVRRCISCSSDQRKSRIDLELRTYMKSEKYPVFDYDLALEVDQLGVLNTSISTDCAWMWIQFERMGYFIWPKTAKFGLANDRKHGVDVSFWTERNVYDQPTISFFFNSNGMHQCDAQIISWSVTEVHCRPMHIESEVATCNVTPYTVMQLSSYLAFETLIGEIRQSEKIACALDKVCTFQKQEFRSSVSKSLVAESDYVTKYSRNLLKDTLRTASDLFNIAHLTLWEAIVNSYDWWYDIIPILEDMVLSKYSTVTGMALRNILSWCENLTTSINEIIKTLYELGSLNNQFMFDFPSLFSPFGLHGKNMLQYYSSFYDMTIWGNNLLTADNCAFGMMHGRSFEQAITMNNYLYYLPRKFRNCPYLLAEDVRDHKFTILFSNNDIVFNMPKSSITIKPDMRLLVGRSDNRYLTTLPYHDDEVTCTMKGTDMHCDSKYATMIVRSENNRRKSFYVKVSAAYCSSCRGFMGKGENKTLVPSKLMMNDDVASSMEEFVDSYSADKKCMIGDMGREPPKVTEPCDTMFEKKQWMDSCPSRRYSFLLACQTGARTQAEACRYAKDFNNLCNTEGRPIEVAPECEVCKEGAVKTTVIDKVQIYVIMSLTSRIQSPTLQRILTSVREMANLGSLNYEIAFVSFGGGRSMYEPAYDVKNGKLYTPSTEEWTIPEVAHDGQKSTYDTLKDAMWLAFRNADKAASGTGKIFLFATPEDMDYVLFNSSVIAKYMKDDMIRSYLLIPNICERMGGKTRATYGVRPLFSREDSNMCMTEAREVARAIAYPFVNKSISCTCRSANPYISEFVDKCQLMV